ncbi:MAG: hypothetical protein AB7P76_06330 [Candidatus Melainabacteria bacterium]
MHLLRRQWIGILLATALLATGVLPWLTAHACCMEPPAQGVMLDAASGDGPFPATMACCEATPQKLSATANLPAGSWTGLATGPAAQPTAQTALSAEAPLTTALLAQIYHKNDRRRHLELSVLLN